VNTERAQDEHEGEDDRRGLDATDEQRHAAGEPNSWREAFLLDFVAGDGAVAGAVGLVLDPGGHRCAFWASLCGPGRQYLTIVEPDLVAPRDLELRAPGMWAEIQCLVPYDHVMFGVEAFAVGLDPVDAFGKLWGDRVPFGLDLEWDTVSPDDVHPADHVASRGYEMHCLVHGEVLVADERIELDGFGSRAHHWGTTHPWTRPRARIVTATHVVDGSYDVNAVEIVAEAPLVVDLGETAPVRVDRALGFVHDAGAPRDRPGRPIWIERTR
jgi:hypothetical protein